MSLPELGIGTYLLKGETCKQAVLDALRLGMRYIDTASQYANEAEVGAAICESGVAREDIFISTKIGPRQTKKGYSGVVSACEDSLRLLGTDYIDLLMLHWPGIANAALDSPKHAAGREEAWRAMADLQRAGKVRRIGVSNFLERHMAEVLLKPVPHALSPPAYAPPLMNQIELHPLCRQRAVVQFCRAHNILVQQYAPVAQCHPRVVTHPAVQKAVTTIQSLLSEPSAMEGRWVDLSTPLGAADVCLLWGFWTMLSDGLVVRSTNPRHMQRALDVLRLFKECSGELRDRLLHALQQLDEATDPSSPCTIGEGTVEAGGGGDFHTCWHSEFVA